MREAAGDISKTVLELTAEEFADAKFTRLAVERLVIILGEAAAKVSGRIQRLRNNLAHDYGQNLALELYRTCLQLWCPLPVTLTAFVRAHQRTACSRTARKRQCESQSQGTGRHG
ncbi:hypothetical protein IV102_31090 [bacterium]|nr:hypothetical protein [bacterium]